MTEVEIRSLLKCPKDTDLKDHLNHLMAVVECQKRERLSDILIQLDGIPPSLAQMGDDDKKVASGVYTNSQWKRYIHDTMNTIRDSSMLDGDNEFLRGRLIALSDAYRFFAGCYQSFQNQTGGVDPHSESRSK